MDQTGLRGDDNALNTIFVGGEFLVRAGSTTLFSTNGYSLTETHLVLGQVQINSDSQANDTLKVWVDPDLTHVDDPASLTAPDFNESGADRISTTRDAAIGIFSYNVNASLPGAIVDHVRISNADTAFRDVTYIAPKGSLIAIH